MGYAFISYSTKEQLSADAMKKLLEKQGIQTWMAPGDIPAGSRYAQVINKAVKGCSCLILMLSENSQNSIWVAKEVERAVNYRKPIIPVQLEDLVLNDEFELYISTDQVVAVKTIDEDSEGIQKILTSAKAIVGINNINYEISQTNNDFNKENIGTSKKTADKSVQITNNYYFKVSLSSNEGRLYLYSPESESVESPVSANVTNVIWNEFVIICKELLSSVFPSTPTSNISIKSKKPLGVYNCAPDDGHNHYDEKFRIDFKVSIVYKQMPKNYDSVHFDLSSDSFEISLFSAGNYVIKNTSAEINLSDFDIDEAKVASAASKMIHFAQKRNSLIISDTFRRKIYSDRSGGYFLDFIEKDIESKMNESQTNNTNEYHKKQNADKIKKCYIALGGIGCRILNHFENSMDSNNNWFLYYDTDTATEKQLNITNGAFHLFKNFSQGLGSLRENGKKLLELSKYMDNYSDLYDIYNQNVFDKSGIELIFVTTSFGGFGSGIVLDFQRIVKNKIRNSYSNEINIDTKIIAFTSDCFSFLGDAKKAKCFESNTINFMFSYYQELKNCPKEWISNSLHLISKPDSSNNQLAEFLFYDEKFLSLVDSNGKYLYRVKETIKPKVFMYKDIQANKNNEVTVSNSFTDFSKNSFSHVFLEKLKIPASIVRIEKKYF